MVKRLGFILLILASLNSFGEGIPELKYSLVSDTTDVNIPKGKCLVYGLVTLGKGAPFEGCKLATENHKFSGISNGQGEYKFLMDIDSARIYAFQVGYNEIVTGAYNFKSKHKVHINFYMEENIRVEMVLKPVIYAYNSKEIEATIKMNLAGKLTFSYPEYNHGWNVIVKEKGLTVLDKSYPYLFWEGESKGLDFQSKETAFNGSFIKTDSSIRFLEMKCKNFGFNQIETTDFITFWAPRIQNYPYAKIEFLIDKQYDLIGELEVIPEPDNRRRVYVLFQGSETFNSSINMTSNEVKPISRDGFTIVEWGGTELPPSKRMNP